VARHALQRAVAGDACVVYQHLDRPHLFRDALHCALAFLELADVKLLNAQAGLFTECSGGLLIASEVGNHGAALLFQRHADGGADLARSACRQCHTCHRFLPGWCLDYAILTPPGETGSTTVRSGFLAAPGLDPIPVRINHERSVVVGTICRAKSRLAVVLSAR